MGGHGGLNILPQKKWNVYNWDNRIKVSKDEAKVKKELDKKTKYRKDKKFSDKISKIKKKDTEDDLRSVNSDEEDRKYKNKLYKEIVENERRDKKNKVTEFFQKMRTVVNEHEHIKLFECEELREKEKIKDDENNIIRDQTLKEKIDKHLHPWYMKKRAEDYKDLMNSNEDEKTKKNFVFENKNDTKFYQILKEESKDKDESFLKKKKHKKHKKHKKKKSSSSARSSNNSDQGINIDELRRQRIEREEKEKKRIQVFIDKINNKEK